MMSVPRGIRNNNPGNIELGIKWDGLCEEQTDGRFCQFVSPEYGIRAIARIFKTYSKKHGIDTIREAIHRWAPPNENDSDNYTEFVASKSGFDPDEKVDLQDHTVLVQVIPWMIVMENGVNPYEYEQVFKGVELSA